MDVVAQVQAVFAMALQVSGTLLEGGGRVVAGRCEKPVSLDLGNLPVFGMCRVIAAGWLVVCLIQHISAMQSRVVDSLCPTLAVVFRGSALGRSNQCFGDTHQNTSGTLGIFQPCVILPFRVSGRTVQLRFSILHQEC